MIKYLGSKRRLVPVLARSVRGGRRRAPRSTSSPAPPGSRRRSSRRGAVRHRGRHRALLRGVRPDLRRHRRHRGRQRRRPRRASTTSSRCPASPATSPRRSASGRGSSSRSTARASTRSATRIARDYAGSPLYPILLTSLIEAADRVDSTTGVQMAYVKQWAPRSYQPLDAAGPAAARRRRPRGARRRARAGGDGAASSISPTSTRPTTSTATSPTTTCGRRSSRGTRPTHYGVACKRVDARDAATKSRVQRAARRCPRRCARSSRDVRARVRGACRTTTSRGSTLDELRDMCAVHGARRGARASTRSRYVGAQIGIHNPRASGSVPCRTCATVSTCVIAGERAEVGGSPTPPGRRYRRCRVAVEPVLGKVDGCDLCEAARITPWFHEDDVCWIAECEICYVPMVVWRFHGTDPPADHLAHMHAELARIAGGDAHRRALRRRQHAQHPRPLPRPRAPEGWVLRARLSPRRRSSVAVAPEPDELFVAAGVGVTGRRRARTRPSCTPLRHAASRGRCSGTGTPCRRSGR